MKKYRYTASLFMGLFGTLSVFAQNFEEGSSEKTNVVKYTVMERFEPELILTAKERENLKKERFEEIKSKMKILDTMSISERKRNKLLEALIEDPFSSKLSKALVDTEFEEID